MSAERLVVSIAAIEHHEYCPRQCALIHVEGLWMDNEHTVRGRAGHHRADTGANRQERGRFALRHLPLWSDVHGLIGRADVVEQLEGGGLIPVEYKFGGRHGDAAALQICAQALCLEEMFSIEVPLGYVWHSSTRRRLEIVTTSELRERTLAAVEEIRRAMGSQSLPAAVDDARCQSCQFLDICLPSLTAHPGRVSRYVEERLR